MTFMEWVKTRFGRKEHGTAGWTAELCEFGDYTPERSYEVAMSRDGKLEVTFTALHDVPVHQQIALSYGIHTSTPESRAAAHDWSAHPSWPPAPKREEALKRALKELMDASRGLQITNRGIIGADRLGEAEDVAEKLLKRLDAPWNREPVELVEADRPE